MNKIYAKQKLANSAKLSHIRSPQNLNLFVLNCIQQMLSCCILNFKSFSYYNQLYTMVLVFELIVDFICFTYSSDNTKEIANLSPCNVFDILCYKIKVLSTIYHHNTDHTLIQLLKTYIRTNREKCDN